MKPHMFADPVNMLLLAHDLERIASGTGPTVEDLEGGPILTDWHVMLCQVPVLVGRVAGHPDRRDGPVMTSQVYAIDYGSRTWARTMNRWYALRDPDIGTID